MGDLESLLLVLVAIYLTECAVWVRRGGVAVVSYWGGRWRVWHPGSVLGNARGALFLSNPFPPFGHVVVGHQSPVSFSPQALLSFTAASINPGWRPSQLARCLRYEEVRSISLEGRNILINDVLFVKAPGGGAARRLAAMVRRLKPLSESDRAAAIRQCIAESFDTEKIRARWREFETRSRTLRLLAIVLFAYLFVLAPALLWHFGFRYAGLGLAAGLLAQTLSLGMLFRRAHRRLFPDGSEERFTPFLTMLLAPPTAIRATDLLGRHLLEDFHPLAVTHVFCPAAKFKTLARHALLDLHFPLLPASPSSDEQAVQTEEWYRRLLMEEVERTVVRAGLEPGDLLQPPSRSEPEHQAYCPRCRAQFLASSATCADCGGRPLRSFPDVISNSED
jgi:hypothetical protein